MARQKAAPKTGAAAIKIVEDEPTNGTTAIATQVADDKPGLGKKFCPHCHARIAARASSCPECKKAIAPKAKKTVKAARSLPAGAGRASTAASNGLATPVALEAGIKFLKAAGSLDEANKTWEIIREVARAVVTPF